MEAWRELHEAQQTLFLASFYIIAGPVFDKKSNEKKKKKRARNAQIHATGT